MTKGVPTHPPNRLPLVFVLLLPMLFSGVGVWEVLRGATTRAECQAIAATLSARTEALQTLEQRNPSATVRSGRDRTALPVGAAVARLQRGQNAAATNLLVARWREPAAWLVVFAGLAATAAGSTGLVMASRASHRGMASRAFLVTAFVRVCRVLPIALGVLLAGLALAVLGSTAFEVSGLQFLPDTEGQITVLAMAGLAYAALALWGSYKVLRMLRLVLSLFQPPPVPLFAVPIVEAEAPTLFVLLRRLAAERQAAMPDTVAVGAVNGFFVTALPHVLHGASVDDGARGTRGRLLHLPLPTLATLDLVELRTVLAHELAHFSGNDTEYSARFQPLHTVLGRSAKAMAVQNTSWGNDAVDRFLKSVVHPHTALADYVHERFDLAVLHWQRVRELEADRAAVASGSAEALGSSLLRVGLVDNLLHAELGRIAEHPDNAPPDLAASVVARTRAGSFGDPAQHGGDQAPHPTDTHPPARQRIAAAGLAWDDTLMAHAGRPVDEAEFAAVRALFADWDTLSRRVTADVRLESKERHQQNYKHLHEMAGATGASTTELHASLRLPALGLLLLGSFCFLMTVGCAWGALYGGPQDREAWPMLSAIAACGVVGLASAAVWTVQLLRGRSLPYLVLTAEGFHSPGFVGVVPWLAVDTLQVSALSSPTTAFHLRPDAELPQRTGVIRRIHVNRRLRAVQFMALLPQGMTAAAFQDLLSRYANAAYAQAALDGGGSEDAPAPGVR